MISIVILWFFIILLSFILLKQLKIQKNIIICIFISILIVLFILNINESIKAALDGCKLWFFAILPTTFPFLIICNLLIACDGISLYSKLLGPLICKPLGLSKDCSFPIIASILCGYPIGAKYSADIYSMGYIDKSEYERLLNIASNVSPLFLIGSVGTALLGNTKMGYILLIANYLSAVIIGFLTKKKRTKISNSSPSINKLNKSSVINLGLVIKTSIENAITTILSIGGFIIIFSVVISLIKNNNYIIAVFKNLENIINLPSGVLYSLFLGSIEITNGCNILSKLSTISLPVKLGIISFLCSFSGLAIIAQVSSFVSETNINHKKYISLKLLQGIISFIITYIIFKFIPLSTSTSTVHSVLNWHPNIFFNILPIAIILISILLFHCLNKLFFHTS